MGKWTKAAKKLKEHLDKREAMASDMEVLISMLKKLPPGQLKKVLSDDVIEVLARYGVSLDD